MLSVLGLAAGRDADAVARGQIAIGAVVVLVLASIVGVGALLEGNGVRKDSQSTKPTPVATEKSESPQAKITDIMVDELLDKLNSAGMGGIKVGDQFRVTGELSGSDYWGTGASGDFSVNLKAKGGANDLSVFVDESDASGWQDGTKVEMVVKMVETTINGETTDGWLRAQSVRTVSGGTTKDAKATDARQKMFGELSKYADRLNRSAGSTIIDSIGPGLTESAINVKLDLGLASSPPIELKAAIQEMNRQIVDLADASGASTPIVKFYLAEHVVAENRYIVDPWDVKFKGPLDD